jgi:hypothetical protein
MATTSTSLANTAKPKEGYLEKFGRGWWKRWQRRYFVLRADTLQWFVTDNHLLVVCRLYLCCWNSSGCERFFVWRNICNFCLFGFSSVLACVYISIID